MEADQAQRFARQWLEAWNDHDLEAILSHYADAVVFHRPRIRVITGENVDSLSGKDELRAYWGKALSMLRDLYFEIDQVLVGSDVLTILYTNERSQTVAETFIFGGDGQVIRSLAAYD